MSARVKTTKYSAAILTAGVALAATSAAYASQTCDSRVAREILQSREYSSMCDCEFVTTRFIAKLQRHGDFQLVLDSVSNNCSGFLGPLTSTVTASSTRTGFPGSGGEDLPAAGSRLGDPRSIDPPPNDPPPNDPPPDDPPPDDPPPDDPPPDDPPPDDPPPDDPPPDDPPPDDPPDDPPYNGGTPFDGLF